MNTPTESTRALPEAAQTDRPTEFQAAILLEVFRLALTTPRSVADVFVTFSAHVGQIDVRVFPQGWQRNLDAGSDVLGNPLPTREVPELTVYVGSDRSDAIAYVPQLLEQLKVEIAKCDPNNITPAAAMVSA